MKVLKSFLLGAAAGLVLAVALALGAYVSPLREMLYLDSDPEIAGLRERLDDIRERLAQDDLDIAAAPAGDPSADSLKAAQAGALKEYRHRRNRMGELSRLHDKPSPAGFAPWALSLRDRLLPGAGILILLSALLSTAMGARRARGRPARVARSVSAQAEALVSFENAVKQVALLSPAAPASPRAGRAKSGSALPEVPAPADLVVDAPVVPSVLSPFASVANADSREPGNSEFLLANTAEGAFPGSASSAWPAGRGAQPIDLGLGWGAPAQPVREAAPGLGLSMEDEEGTEADGEGASDPAGPFPPGPLAEAQPNGPAQNQFMPPTTEVERVERRKDEVLKLARKGLTSSEISRRMRISQDQVEFIIRMRREKG
ncbi:MAG TPA: hypothetical protein VK465_13685 [Fibrobacteria bacterium]|nr:hypothetical protein [Fibrobacteria bacterium]